MISSRFATALMGCLPSAFAHGFIEFPPLRGGTALGPANAYCPHCGNGAGICGDGGQWGEDSDLLNFARGPVTRLKAGETAEFSVKITAHHKGFFEFRICDQHLDGTLSDPEGCLNQHVLRRAPPAADCKVNDGRGDCQPLDTRHPGRWYLPPGAGTYKMKYEIPADLRCASCTLQWQWWTANSCSPGEDTGCYWADFAAQGWDQAAWCGYFCGSCSSLLQSNSSSTAVRGCGEEFRNCADIAVVEDGADLPVVEDGGNAGGSVMTPSTSSEAASSGSSQLGSCSAVWGQCGGTNWKGPYCCAAGSSCVDASEWYSQCKPGVDSSTAASSKSTTLEAPSSGSSQLGSCSAVWGQCGGKIWKGPSCCAAGSSCVEHNEWYSQCTPGVKTRALLQRQKLQKFLGLGLIQNGSLRARGLVSDEL